MPPKDYRKRKAGTYDPIDEEEAKAREARRRRRAEEKADYNPFTQYQALDYYAPRRARRPQGELRNHLALRHA